MTIVCDGIAPNSTPSLDQFDAKSGNADSPAAFLELRQQCFAQFRGKRIQLRQSRGRNLDSLLLPNEEFTPVAPNPHAEVPTNQISRRTKNAEGSANRPRSQQRRAIPFPGANVVRIHWKCDDLEAGDMQPLQNGHLLR
jgi:hypothetical protein